MRYSDLPQLQSGQLIAGLAYHMLNILTVIQGRAYLVEQQPTEVHRHLAVIHTQVERATRLVHLLEGWADGVKPAEDILDLNSLVMQAATQYRDDFPSLPVRLELGHLVGVRGDRLALRTALGELILNALEANPMTAVTIRTLRDGDRIIVEVEDDGVGLTPATMKRVYEPYYTTHPNRFGLGLTVAGQVAVRHRGDLHLVSQPGILTRASFSIPIAA